jgi:hypothetical protein
VALTAQNALSKEIERTTAVQNTAALTYAKEINDLVSKKKNLNDDEAKAIDEQIVLTAKLYRDRVVGESRLSESKLKTLAVQNAIKAAQAEEDNAALLEKDRSRAEQNKSDIQGEVLSRLSITNALSKEELASRTGQLNIEREIERSKGAQFAIISANFSIFASISASPSISANSAALPAPLRIVSPIT